LEGVTARAAPSDLGYPELRARVTDTRIVAPRSVPAGRYLYTLENATSQESALSVGIAPLPNGMTLADLEASRRNSAATPSPVAPLVTWYYTARWAGAPIPLPGASASAIVDLAPGEHVVVRPEPASTQPAHPMTVTEGPDPATSPEPPADATVTFRDHAFDGIPDFVAAGRHVWKQTNTGRQPHLMYFLRYPELLTRKQAAALYALSPDATLPTEWGIDPTKVAPAGGAGPLPSGGTDWGIYDLERGSYLAVCFVPDLETGAPHAALGMTRLFFVA
jgi:hypothetical protein